MWGALFLPVRVFHTCRQAASVTPPCESLAFILNELSFQLEGRQNTGFRTTWSWWAKCSLAIIDLGVVSLRAVLNLGDSWPKHSHLMCWCFISRQVNLLYHALRKLVMSQTSLGCTRQSRIGNKWEMTCSGLSSGSSSQVSWPSVNQLRTWQCCLITRACRSVGRSHFCASLQNCGGFVVVVECCLCQPHYDGRLLKGWTLASPASSACTHRANSPLLMLWTRFGWSLSEGL